MRLNAVARRSRRRSRRRCHRSIEICPKSKHGYGPSNGCSNKQTKEEEKKTYSQPPNNDRIRMESHKIESKRFGDRQ